MWIKRLISSLVAWLVMIALAIAADVARAQTELPPPERFSPPSIQPPTFPDVRFSVGDYGARGDGAANDTAAINRAIDACSAAGGGTVFFARGRYTVASIRLRNNVRLLLDPDATLIGAKEGYEHPESYPFGQYQDSAHSQFRNAVIWGDGVENVAIEGGRINGGGAAHGGDVRPGQGDKIIAIRSG